MLDSLEFRIPDSKFQASSDTGGAVSFGEETAVFLAYLSGGCGEAATERRPPLSRGNDALTVVLPRGWGVPWNLERAGQLSAPRSRVPRQVGVRLQSLLVVAAQAGRLLERDLAGAHRDLDGAAHLLDQRGACRTRRSAARPSTSSPSTTCSTSYRPSAIERDVHRVGVAEQVVQVAEDLLVGADQEDAEVVGRAVGAGAARGRP